MSRQRTAWTPQWTDDEAVAVRKTNKGLLFFDGDKLNEGVCERERVCVCV